MEEVKEKLVSIIMCVFNEDESWLSQSIQSIQNQTFFDFEFIIVNDNPKRALNEELVLRFMKNDDRIIYLKNSENIGLTKSLNYALLNTKGKYIARMDADDISFPSRIEKQAKFLNHHSDIVAVGTWIEVFGEKKKFNKEYRIRPEEVRNFQMIYTPIAHPTVMFRRETVEKFAIRYNEEFKYAQDYDFFYQLSKVGQLSNIPEVLLKYRTTQKQISKEKNQSQKEFAQKIRKEIITELIGTEIITRLGVFSLDMTVKAFLRTCLYSLKVKRTAPDIYNRLNVLKYVLLMSPKNISNRIFFLMILFFTPFQKIGFSFRYYLKALSNQLFSNFTSLI